jgi:hypothetical protein
MSCAVELYSIRFVTSITVSDETGLTVHKCSSQGTRQIITHTRQLCSHQKWEDDDGITPTAGAPQSFRGSLGNARLPSIGSPFYE